MKQITIFDIIAQDTPAGPQSIVCGYIKDTSIVGREIAFQDLRAYIGKKIIKAEGTTDRMNFKVCKVIEYYDGCDTFYKRVRPLPPNKMRYGPFVNSFIHDVVGIKECMQCYEPAFICDRVALSDNDKNQANAWVSEAYCSNGRFEPVLEYPAQFLETFYEINA